MTSEYPPKIDDLVAAIQRRFAAMGVIVALECVAFGWGYAQLAPSLPWIAGVGIGAAVGAAILFVINDWGHRLDHRPRGLNLVKARTGTAVLALMLPLGPLFAWDLSRRLREPVLVRHAVANHPEAGSESDEQLLATIRARSAFVTMRTFGIVVVGVATVGLFFGALAVYSSLTTEQAPEVGTAERVIYGGSVGAMLMGIYLVACAMVGLSRLREITGPRIASARKIAWMVAPLFPVGTYVAWAMTRAFPDSPPPPS